MDVRGVQELAGGYNLPVAKLLDQNNAQLYRGGGLREDFSRQANKLILHDPCFISLSLE